jgi:Polyketide cyclase / dehydrase and lipid transport
MASTTRLGVSRTVHAPPHEVFALVCDPAGQVSIDGSGMLKAAPEASVLRSVGDTFVMEMDREPLGDLPMGRYTSFNTVTKFEPDSLLEWSVGTPERPSWGHVYGWEITAAGTSGSEVTNYCDWSGVGEERAVHYPVVPEAMMQRSVDNLAAHFEGVSEEPA